MTGCKLAKFSYVLSKLLSSGGGGGNNNDKRTNIR